jgi:formylglycine-generating enzyme required for sulfatase activity
VGLLYGPSGCGKSSLVKAGLLPRLTDKVLAVYVEATGHETEARLLNGLRKRCPALPPGLGLRESLAAVRRGQGVPASGKVLLALDQLEQWLHAHREEESGELVQALRQCDGGRVQCLLLVRDDFWLAVSRFVRALEVDLVPGRNIALVDLFDPDHARRVLAAFGRAFGKLPEGLADPDKAQQAFLNQAVGGLAQEGKVVCVRLALFAEMLKGKPWTRASLKAVGGAAGVGVTFLEETFSSPVANPRHRLHQKAARAVLQALLPESGADLKGHMRSHAELLAASGYAGRPREFEDLLRILDGELRLLTPTDPEGVVGEPRASATGGALPTPVADASGSPGRYYQLTHDYLVPSLRHWLTRNQKETWRGRAELCLAERAALWGPRPERRYLPSAWEWLTISLGTRRRDLTAVERKMLRRATLLYALRGLIGAAVLILLGWGFTASVDYGTAKILCDWLEVTETARLLPLGPNFAWCRDYADPMLRERLARTGDDRLRLHYSIALLPSDPGQVDYLRERLVNADAPPGELLVIREALESYQERLREGLWQVADKDLDPARQFRAACALAGYDADSPRWGGIAPDVAGSLVVQNADLLGQWVRLLAPVRLRLLPALGSVFRRGQPQARTLATGALAVYAADQPEVLAELLMDADEEQWKQLWPKLSAQPDRAVAVFQQRLAEPMPAEHHLDARERLAKQQAQAAVALLRLGQPDSVWPLLRHSPDPSRRTYLLHRLGPLDADPQVLIPRLEDERDVSARRGLILSLGEFTREQLPMEVRQPLTAKLLAWYRYDPDPGIHAAIDWLLRHEKEGEVPRKLDWKQAEGLRRIDAALAGKPPDRRRSYVNGYGQTMVLLPSPAEFHMGSLPREPARMLDETQHLRKIPRSYALAAKPVTVAEFQWFLKVRPEIGQEFYNSSDVATSLKQYSPAADGPIIFVNWYKAAAYCNWLSEQEGVPKNQWVYPADPGAIRPGMTMPDNYLHLTGYRLPTEAEWEYACRARSGTPWSMGAAEEPLLRYAWYEPNSQHRAWPVGQKKPNDFGLFDMHGNVFVWCQDRHVRPFPKVPVDQAVVDSEDTDKTLVTERVMRGGGFAGASWWLRSASRDYSPPTQRQMLLGVRVARTLPEQP